MLIVHIGAKKAGSSSIQTFLSANEELLRRFSIDYARAGRTNSNSHQNYDNLDEIKNRKKKNAADRQRCRIVFVIRDLVDLIPSVFSQQTRHGSDEGSFDEFFEKMMEHSRTDFFNTAERWASVFGWASMEVRTLDKRDLKNGDLLDELIFLIGAEQIAGQLEKTTNRNISRSWKSLEAVRALFTGRHRLPSDHPILLARDRFRDSKLLGRAAMKLSDKLGWNRDTARYLTVEQAERCRERYCVAVESINRHLARKIPMPLDLETRKFEGREVEPDVSRISSAELRAFYEELWLLLQKMESDGRTTTRGSPRNHKNIALELNKNNSPAPQPGSLDFLSAEWRGRHEETLILSSEFFERTTRRGIVKLREAFSIPRGKRHL